MTILNFSSTLRHLIANSQDPSIILISIQLGFQIIPHRQETLEDWVLILRANHLDIGMQNDILMFIYGILESQNVHNDELVEFVLKRTTEELSHISVNSISTQEHALEGKIETKLVGFQLIGLFIQNPTSRKLVLNRKYLDFCLGYLTFSPSGSFDNSWKLHELKSIHSECLSHLTSLFQNENLLEDAESLSCDPILAQYLHEAQRFDTGEVDPSLLNLVNPSFGLIHRYLGFIRELCKYGDSVRRKLGSLGLLQSVVNILNLKERWVTPSMIRASCQAISALCAGSECNPRSLNQLVMAQTTSGIYILSNLIYYTNPNFERQRLIRLAIMNAIWSAVCGCRLNEEAFFEYEGIQKLISLLPQAERDVKSHILSLILDLLENPKARSHLIAWKTEQYSNVLVLLLDIWRKEEGTRWCSY
jgi:mannitol/fructose-specific phosphotransferase system IIA component (Ntr-type)